MKNLMLGVVIGWVLGWVLRSFWHLLWPSGPRVTDQLSNEWLNDQKGK